MHDRSIGASCNRYMHEVHHDKYFTLIAKVLGMGTFKNEIVWYGIGTNEMLRYFKGTVDGTSLHFYLMNFVVNIHV